MFQNAKIQDLNVIHNYYVADYPHRYVVSECKDTRFECNSQLIPAITLANQVVSECKDTRFECNSQLTEMSANWLYVVSECKDTRFECNSQPEHCATNRK